MVIVFEIICEVCLGDPRIIFEHICGKFGNSVSRDTVKGEHSDFPLYSFYFSSLDSQGLFGGEVNDGVLGVLEEVVDHKIEDVGVVVLLVEDLCGEDLNEGQGTHFPFSLTMRKT